MERAPGPLLVSQTQKVVHSVFYFDPCSVCTHIKRLWEGAWDSRLIGQHKQRPQERRTHGFLTSWNLAFVAIVLKEFSLLAHMLCPKCQTLTLRSVTPHGWAYTPVEQGHSSVVQPEVLSPPNSECPGMPLTVHEPQQIRRGKRKECVWVPALFAEDLF